LQNIIQPKILPQSDPPRKITDSLCSLSATAELLVLVLKVVCSTTLCLKKRHWCSTP